MEIIFILAALLIAASLGLFFVASKPVVSQVHKPDLTKRQSFAADEHMNEGDFHSGPYGYSPNTAYPETQYGSMFDEDAEWHGET